MMTPYTSRFIDWVGTETMVTTAADVLAALSHSRLAPYPLLFIAGRATETTAAEVLPAGGTAPPGEFPLPDFCCIGGGACISNHSMEPYTVLKALPAASLCRCKYRIILWSHLCPAQ